MSLAKQLPIAIALMAGTVGALTYFGRSNHAAEGGAAPAASSLLASPSSSATPSSPSSPAPTGASIRHGARALVPQEAWLVADFSGDLTGARPFEDQDDACKDVPAPPRVALGLLPPLAKSSEGPELLLAAPEVADVFWGCARDRIVRAGGNVLAQNDQFEVLKSPSGVVARGPNRSMIFVSNEGYLERTLTVISDLDQSAANTGAHGALFRRLHPSGVVERPTVLDMTLQLPPDWLSGVGQDARVTPLRHLQSAYLSVFVEGGAAGGISCAEPGCDELKKFLQSAKGDLLKMLPADRAPVVDASLQFESEKGRINVRWTSTGAKLQDILGGLLSGSGPGSNWWGGGAPSPQPRQPSPQPRQPSPQPRQPSPQPHQPQNRP